VKASARDAAAKMATIAANFIASIVDVPTELLSRVSCSSGVCVCASLEKTPVVYDDVNQSDVARADRTQDGRKLERRLTRLNSTRLTL
jgi:hypothetical protein